MCQKLSAILVRASPIHKRDCTKGCSSGPRAVLKGRGGKEERAWGITHYHPDIEDRNTPFANLRGPGTEAA